MWLCTHVAFLSVAIHQQLSNRSIIPFLTSAQMMVSLMKLVLQWNFLFLFPLCSAVSSICVIYQHHRGLMGWVKMCTLPAVNMMLHYCKLPLPQSQDAMFKKSLITLAATEARTFHPTTMSVHAQCVKSIFACGGIVNDVKGAHFY